MPSNAYAAARRAGLIARNIATHGIAKESREALLLRRTASGGEALVATASRNFERKRVRDTFANQAATTGVNFVDIYEFPADLLTATEGEKVTLIAHNGIDYTVSLGAGPEGRKQSWKFKIKSRKPSPVLRLYGLEALYRMEEASGDRQDLSGNKRPLTASGTLTRVAGKVGYACEFATSGKLSLDVSGFLAPPFTLCGWFKGPVETYGDIWTIKSSVHDIDEYPLTLVRNVTAFQLITADENDVPYYGPDFGNVAADTWAFLRLAVPDMQTVQVYVNEVALGEAALPAPMRADWTDLVIGNALSQGNMTGAAQDEVALYSRLLTTAEGAALYAMGGAGLALV